MCGRYAAKKDPAALAAEFDAVDGTGDHAPEPDYNIAPTKKVFAVVARANEAADESDTAPAVRSIRVLRWGLVPSWAKDRSIASKLFNGRSETAASKPSFRDSVARRRCLLPAEGWYEWRRDGNTKQPYFVTRPDGASLAMAGVWSVWRDKDAAADAPPLITAAVLTTAAIGPLAEVHHRMPLLLPRQRWSAWLDPHSTDVGELLATPPSDELVAGLELRPVSDAVNNIRNNGPELMEQLADAARPVDLDQPNCAESGQSALFNLR